MSQARVLCGDDKGGDDDEDDAECFEGRRERAVVGPFALQEIGDGESHSRAAEETFYAPADGRSLLGIGFFLCEELQMNIMSRQ